VSGSVTRILALPNAWQRSKPQDSISIKLRSPFLLAKVNACGVKALARALFPSHAFQIEKSSYDQALLSVFEIQRQCRRISRNFIGEPYEFQKCGIYVIILYGYDHH